MNKMISFWRIGIVSVLTIFTGCATNGIKFRIDDYPAIQSLRYCEVIKADEWKKTNIQIREGETIILTPLYPKGFIYPVKGRVGKKSFDALDVDSGNVYTAESTGFLELGVLEKPEKIPTGVFIFRESTIEVMISDLEMLLEIQKDSMILNLTLGIINKNISEAFIAKLDTSNALECLNQAIHYFTAVDHKTYATTLYRLYKSKARIYHLNKDQQAYEENLRLAMDSLMRASKHYKLLTTSKYAFLNRLSPEERFVLLTKTDFFRIAKAPYYQPLGISFANLVVAYTMLSRYYTESGNLSLSLTYSELAIDEAQKIGDRDLIAWAYMRGLAARHYALGFYDLAKKEYKTSLQLCSSSATACRWGAQFAMILCQYHLGEFETAENSLKKMDLAVRFDPVGSLRRYYIKYRLGLIHLKQEKYRRAIPFLQSAYTGFNRQRQNAHFITPTKSIGAGLALCRAYIGLGYYDKATNRLNQIMKEVSSVDGLLTRELDFKLTQAALYRKLGKDPSQPLLQAIETLEKIRPTAATSRDYGYWVRMLTVYNETVDNLFERNDYEGALEVAEKARSRRFLDHIGSKSLGAKKATSYLLSLQTKDSLESLSLIEKEMLQAAKTADIKVRSIYQEGTRYSKSLTTLRTKFVNAASKDPQLKSIYNIKPVKLKTVQKNLPDDVVLIEYYLSADTLYTWVINNKQIFAHKQTIAQQRITDLIIEFRKTLLAPQKARGIMLVAEAPTSKRPAHTLLYDILIAPIETHIKAERIGIVPYGVLHYLPFQALYDGNQYLIQKFAISYIPSLSVLKFVQKKIAPQGPVTILAFGNPELGDATLDLPATEKEVEIIQTIFPSTTILKRVNASEANAKALVGHYSHIHFASHGEYRPEVPLSSCLRLTPGNGEDGRLEAGEVFDLNLDADMVVTSACQTAIGKIREGDEIVGLTRAFIYAGARSILGTLWNISDEATADFMQVFYSNMRKTGKVEALQQAQLKMIASEKYRHPFYWAAFNMTGGL